MSFTGFSDIVQLLAHSTGFAALSSTGEVYTWGDERFVGCLGRDVTDEWYVSVFSLLPLFLFFLSSFPFPSHNFTHTNN